MQPFKKLADLNLRTKLLLVYLSLSTILFTSGGLGALYMVGKAAKANVENDLRNGTRAIINMVETTVQGSITNYLRAVAERNLEIAHLTHELYLEGELTELQSRERIREILLGQTIGKTGYIYCIDSQGVATVHPNPGVEGNSWDHFEFVRQQTRRKTGYLEYDWQNPGEGNPRAKALYMTYFEPYDWIISVSTYREEFMELLPMEEIRRSVKDLTFGATGYVFVTDRQGNTIIHPELEGRNFYDLTVEDTRFFEEMLAEEFGQVAYWWQNPAEHAPRRKIAQYGHIPELHWIVGATGYVDEIYAPVRQARNTVLVFILVAVALSTILTLAVSRSLTRRLQDLMAVITRGDQGDLTVRVSAGADDEIGRLGRIFNTFLARLQAYHDQLTAEIDEHRATTVSLKKSNDFNELILSTVQALVIVLDRDGRVIRFNRACEKSSGYSADEIEGHNVIEKLVPIDQQEKVGAVIEEVAGTRKSNRHTNDWITKAGQRRLIKWSNAFIPGPDREVEFIVGAGLDITDQKVTESALKKSEALFEAVFNQAYQFIGVLTPDGTVRSINQTALDFAGVEENELIGQKFWETPFWDQFEKSKKRMEKAVLNASRGHFERMEVGQKRVDGEKRYVDFTLKPIEDDAGKVIMLIAEGRDITDQKRMESQLLQSQKMDAIGTLAGGIAHDFNNNLQAISGYTQLLLLDGFGSNREKEMLTTIQHACGHASELTRQLLTFSRKVESRLVPLDLNTELRNVIKLLQRTLPRMIGIETRLAADLYIARADRVQFEQVMMNLGINAGHAMPEGGTLTIETANVDLDDIYCRAHVGAVPGPYAMLSITDTGYGMDANTREHVFEPFFTTRETGSGTGLGLAMVYGIVKSHNGYIECQSEPGEGTVFSIYFPAATGGGTAEKPLDKAIQYPKGHESILLVDDDQAVREVGREILEQFGYRVIEAEDGESGLDRHQEFRDKIDLILLDLNMPGMGGRRFLEKLRERSPAIPVLVTSGDVPKGEVKTILDELTQGFVAKPYEIGILLTMVRQTLDRETLPAPSEK